MPYPVTTFQLFQIFKRKFGEDDALTLVYFIEEKLTETNEQNQKALATKSDKIELVSKIETAKTDIVKWMFAFWIGSIGVISGIMFAFFNAYLKH